MGNLRLNKPGLFTKLERSLCLLADFLLYFGECHHPHIPSVPPAVLTPPAAPLGCRCRWSRPGRSSSCSECCPGEGWLTTARRSLTWRRRGKVPSAGWIFTWVGGGGGLEYNSLFACGGKEPHHLHGQLKPLKVML